MEISLPKTTCGICGTELTAVSHSELNSELVKHGMREHYRELQRSAGDCDLIGVADYLREGELV